MSLPHGVGSSVLGLTVGSEKILDDMLQAVNGTFYDGSSPVAPYDCSALPPLVLTISGEGYRMPPEKFTRSIDDRHCQINVEVAPDTWEIGFTFVQEYCLVVDYDNERIGFAENLVE